MPTEGKSDSSQPSPATPPASPSSPAPVLASLQDFQKLVLRVGTIVTATVHPNADRLLVLSVDLGEGAPRQLVAGIKGSYQPETLLGKQVVVVSNLQPATIRGVESQGMVLAAHDGSGSQLALLTLDRPIQPGGTIK